jgi:hypothetical protein
MIEVGMTAILTMLSLLVGVDPAPTKANADLERTRQQAVATLAPAKARQLTVFLRGEQDSKPAVLTDKPLLRWSNATAGSVYGEVFVWSMEGRPVAIASIYSWYEPYQTSTVEIVSLSESGVGAKEKTQSLWQAPAGEVIFHPIPTAPRPANSRPARLTQMREIAARFAAELADIRSGEQVTRQLRLLNQPAHRFASDQQGILDGALFAFVEGTDPEVWIQLEVYQDKGEPRWRYAAVRMNAGAMRLRYGETVVAEFENIPEPWLNSKATYFNIGFDPNTVATDKAAGAGR